MRPPFVMGINEIKDTEIREYLLGGASPESAERLDELAFTDDFADRLGAVEREIVDEYVNGSLPAAGRRAFESHYLSTPLCREKVRFANALAAHTLASATSEQTKEKVGFFESLRNWRMMLQLGMAAAGLLVISLFGWLVYRNAGQEVATVVEPTPVAINTAQPQNVPVVNPTIEPPTLTQNGNTPASNAPRPTPEPKQSRTPEPVRTRATIATFILTPALRGDTVQTLHVPKDAQSAEFRLRLETEATGPLSAEVFELRGQARIWATRSLAQSGGATSRLASFRVPVKSLSPGEHRISIYAKGPDGGQEKVGDYFFRVVQ